MKRVPRVLWTRSLDGFARLVGFLHLLGALLILAMMALICADIVGRNLFNAPIRGVAELVALAIVAIVFLQFASTLRHGRLAGADLFLGRLVSRGSRFGRGLQALFLLIGAGVCATICWATWPMLVSAWTEGLFIGVQGQFTAPTWPVRAVIVAGSALACLQFLLLAGEQLRTPGAPAAEKTEMAS